MIIAPPFGGAINESREKMIRYADLHLHTSASDGTDLPCELIDKAIAAGLDVIAITDHDTVKGVKTALKYAESKKIKVLSGIEISADYNGREVHILGYNIDPDSDSLNGILTWAVNERTSRNAKMIELMQNDGIDVTLEEIKRENEGAVIGRPHMAAALVKKGFVSDIKEAFDRYLGEGKKYYVGRTFLPAEDAVGIIINAGGTFSVAHPFQYGFDEPDLDTYLKTMRALNAGSCEVYYTGYDAQMSEKLIDLSNKYSLSFTGGSDYHGRNKPDITLGSIKIDTRKIEILK